MKKVQEPTVRKTLIVEPTARKTLTAEPTVRKTLTVATRRLRWRSLIGLAAAIVVMSVVVLSGQELKHVPPAAPTFSVLYSFNGGDASDGAGPNGLVRDTAGNLYGTTTFGGVPCPAAIGCGTVFKLTPTGTETLLYSFGWRANPADSLILDRAGNLYGTTPDFRECILFGSPCGTVFKLDPTGSFTALYTFGDDVTGFTPIGSLIQDGAGNLYGTTSEAGAGGAGVVYELIHCNSGCGFKALYSFTGGADGGNPQAGLIPDAAGNLYGTTYSGGAHGNGVVFELIRCHSAPSGYEYRVLHSFAGGSDGANPVASLIRDAAGNLYGTTAQGGDQSSACNFEQGTGGNGTCGVVFKLSPTGTETVLHSFTGGADGGNPVAGLVRDAAGNLYGTTQNGGAESRACGNGAGNGPCGVVFKLSSCGSGFKVLHTFTGGADGGIPTAGLIQDPAGNLYGTASTGGSGVPDHAGVVFKLTP